MIRRIVDVSGDDEIVVESRQGAGYEALYVAFSRLRYSYKTEAALRRAFSDAFGPVSFATSVDSGPVTLLLFYFDSNELEHPVDPDEARRLTEPLVTTWEDRVSAALEAEFGASEGRRLFQRYVQARVEERPLPRGDRPRAGARRPAPVRGAREPARGRGQREGRRAGLGAAVLGAPARPHRHPEDAAEPRAHGHRRAAHPAHAAGRPALPALPLRDRGLGRADRRAARRARSASSTRCERSTRSAPPTTR